MIIINNNNNSTKHVTLFAFNCWSNLNWVFIVVVAVVDDQRTYTHILLVYSSFYKTKRTTTKQWARRPWLIKEFHFSPTFGSNRMIYFLCSQIWTVLARTHCPCISRISFSHIDRIRKRSIWYAILGAIVQATAISSSSLYVGFKVKTLCPRSERK